MRGKLILLSLPPTVYSFEYFNNCRLFTSIKGHIYRFQARPERMSGLVAAAALNGFLWDFYLSLFFTVGVGIYAMCMYTVYLEGIAVEAACWPRR